jgi:hypothetical protein
LVPQNLSAAAPAAPAPLAADGDPAVELLLDFARVGRALFRPHLAKESGGTGPAPRHLITLAVLHRTGTVTVGQLADRLQLSLTTTSLMVADLARLGLVERREDPADRRRTLVSVTGGGAGSRAARPGAPSAAPARTLRHGRTDPGVRRPAPRTRPLRGGAPVIRRPRTERAAATPEERPHDFVHAFFTGLGRFSVRFRWPILVGWVLLAAAATAVLPSLASQVKTNNTSFLPASVPSQRAADLASPLQRANLSPVPVLVATTNGTPLTAADQRSITGLEVALRRVPGRRAARPRAHPGR